MPTLDPNYDAFEEYLLENNTKAKENFKDLHKMFKDIFHRAIVKATTENKTRLHQKGQALGLLIRACKYCYTSHSLALQGSPEESFILHRSIVELLLLSILIAEDDEVYALWQECYSARSEAEKFNGHIDVSKFKEKKYTVSEILKTTKLQEKIRSLLRMRGELSTRFSHENLYNIVIRFTTATPTSTNIYIGNNVNSDNSRAHVCIQESLSLIGLILNAIEEIEGITSIEQLLKAN